MIGDPAAVADYVAELRPRVAGDVRADDVTRVLYSTDASIYQVPPLAVVVPRTADDVQAAVELAARHRLPVLPRGGGTSLAGQAVNAAIVVDMSRHLDRILDVDPEARRARVEPGVVLDDLNRRLRPHGLQFGPDPASADRATLGGVVGNNATGSHSIVHGMTVDHVQAMDVVLDDGSLARFEALDDGALAERRRRGGREGDIYRGLAALLADPAHRAAVRAGTPRHWRRAGGYNVDRLVQDGVRFHHPPDPRPNLAALVCGSEGTLATMTAVDLGLVPLPARTALAIAHFGDLQAALRAVPAILETGPSAVELLDGPGMRLCQGVPFYARLLAGFVSGSPGAVLIVEYGGTADVDPSARIDDLRARLAREIGGAGEVVAATTPAAQAAVWTVRKASLGLLMSARGDVKPLPFIEDAAVPVDRLADYVAEVERFCRDLGTALVCYAHASAGCLHLRPMIDAKRAADVAKLPHIAQFAMALVKDRGGALASEHGDGRTRSWLGPAFFGPELFAVYRGVKQVFDPGGRLNPGNVVDAPAMTDHLRHAGPYHPIGLATHIDFAAEGGFERAVEQCNGAGVCRKLGAGTMCPSFMVTREEVDSTRGRANALRAAMTGRLPASALSGEAMDAVMDLCVGCKACQAECPSAVDMAKLKVEYLARRNAAHGLPPRAWLLSEVGRLGRWGAGPLAPLAAAALGRPAVRRVLERRLGITRERPLPAPAREPLTAWLRRRGGSPPGGGEPPSTAGGGAERRADGRRVALLPDTFNAYFTPAVAIAAVELFEAAGLAVVVPRVGCCGRPLLSHGRVAAARAAARAMVDALSPLAAAGIPIVGLEPSCVSMFGDEYAYLLPGDPAARAVADAASTFDAFVATRAGTGDVGWAFDGRPRRLLLHGHCHQQAREGTAAAHAALALPAGHRVEAVDAGCCGMAGAFGYEAEHHAVSLAMAEQRLLPAVRAAAPDDVIVAAGFSCRQQIAHATGRRAWHPAEVLRAALDA